MPTGQMLSLPIIAPAANTQFQSPLIRLPAEIKHIIYGYCFTADSPIVDPAIRCSPSRNTFIPRSELGLTILRTCRGAYHDADIRPLFSRNTFRFTNVDRARCFFQGLGSDLAAHVQDIEFDAKNVSSGHPDIARELLHYISWGCAKCEKDMSGLHIDAPGLNCLRFNFDSWPCISMYRADLWNLLRNLLQNVQGLDRIVVTGASKGSAMARREPWSPVHYVGGNDVGADDLVQRMWRAVGDVNDRDKIIRWTRSKGKIHLEVVAPDSLHQQVGGSWGALITCKSRTDAWPENGSCSWSAYENRNSGVTEPTTKGINPSAAE